MAQPSICVPTSTCTSTHCGLPVRRAKPSAMLMATIWDIKIQSIIVRSAVNLEIPRSRCCPGVEAHLVRARDDLREGPTAATCNRLHEGWMIRTEVGKYIVNTSLSTMSASIEKPVWANWRERWGFTPAVELREKHTRRNTALYGFISCSRVQDMPFEETDAPGKYACVEYLPLSHPEVAHWELEMAGDYVCLLSRHQFLHVKSVSLAHNTKYRRCI